MDRFLEDKEGEPVTCVDSLSPCGREISHRKSEGGKAVRGARSRAAETCRGRSKKMKAIYDTVTPERMWDGHSIFH